MTTRALAALGLALAATGCVDAQANLFLTGICGLPDDTVICKAPAGKCDTYQNGALSVYSEVTIEDPANPLATITYFNQLYPVAEVINRAPNNADAATGRVNGKDALIETATVKYASSGLAISTVTVPSLFTPVPAGGQATIFLPVMTSFTVAEISGQLAADDVVGVMAEIKLNGHYNDGASFETGPLMVPVLFANSVFDARNTCTDPTQARFFCYGPGQGGNEKCAAP